MTSSYKKDSKNGQNMQRKPTTVMVPWELEVAKKDKEGNLKILRLFLVETLTLRACEGANMAVSIVILLLWWLAFERQDRSHHL